MIPWQSSHSPGYHSVLYNDIMTIFSGDSRDKTTFLFHTFHFFLMKILGLVSRTILIFSYWLVSHMGWPNLCPTWADITSLWQVLSSSYSSFMIVNKIIVSWCDSPFWARTLFKTGDLASGKLFLFRRRNCWMGKKKKLKKYLKLPLWML